MRLSGCCLLLGARDLFSPIARSPARRPAGQGSRGDALRASFSWHSRESTRGAERNAKRAAVRRRRASAPGHRSAARRATRRVVYGQSSVSRACPPHRGRECGPNVNRATPLRAPSPHLATPDRLARPSCILAPSVYKLPRVKRRAKPNAHLTSSHGSSAAPSRTHTWPFATQAQRVCGRGPKVRESASSRRQRNPPPLAASKPSLPLSRIESQLLAPNRACNPAKARPTSSALTGRAQQRSTELSASLLKEHWKHQIPRCGTRLVEMRERRDE